MLSLNYVRVLPEEIQEIDEIRPVLNRYSEKTGARLYLSCPHGRVAHPYSGRIFDWCIYLYSVPEKLVDHQVDMAYGVRLRSHQGDAVKMAEPTTIPHVKLYDPYGELVAYIVGKSVYVLFDLGHESGRSPGRILGAILDDLTLFGQDRARFDAEMAERWQNRGIKYFQDAIRFAVENTNYDRSIAEVEDRLRGLLREVTLANRSRQGLLVRKEKGITADLIEERVQAAKRMYGSLRKIAADGEVKMVGSVIEINVGQIDIEWNDTIYDIGEFVVTIDINNGTVRCRNLTRDVNDHAHPHVGSSNVPCFGDATYGLGILIGDLQFDVAFMMVIEFLRSYNPAGAYSDAQIKYWPVKGAQDD